MRIGRRQRRIVLVSFLIAGMIAGYRVYVRERFHRAREAADAALARRDFRAAGQSLDECLDLRPDDADLHLLAARTARRRGDFTTARHELQLHERLSPRENQLRRRELALIDLQLGLDPDAVHHQLASATAAPWSEESAATLEAAIPAVIRDLTNAYGSGMSMVEGPAFQLRGKVESAVARWLEHHPNAADRAIGYFWLGRSRALVHPRDGIADYRRALELNTRLAEARLHLAEALLESDLAEAAAHLERLRGEPEPSDAVFLMLARVRRELGQYVEARGRLDELLTRKEDSAAALLERGQLELDAGRPEDGIEFLLRASRAAPRDPPVHLALSRAFHLTGRESESATHQRQFHELEQKRLEGERIRNERRRDEWRKRVDSESLRKDSKP